MKSFLVICVAAVMIWACNKPEQKVAEAASSPEPVAKKAPAEYGDTTLVEICKRGIDAMTAGDVDGFLAGYSDSARYFWNSGDSIVGKAAIHAYWKDRRANVIDKIGFTENIWLPIKSNEYGDNWVFLWTRVNATYKTGKSMSQLMHMDYHFDKNNKIDRVYHYLDRAPIMAATKK